MLSKTGGTPALHAAPGSSPTRITGSPVTNGSRCLSGWRRHCHRPDRGSRPGRRERAWLGHRASSCNSDRDPVGRPPALLTHPLTPAPTEPRRPAVPRYLVRPNGAPAAPTIFTSGAGLHPSGSLRSCGLSCRRDSKSTSTVSKPLWRSLSAYAVVASLVGRGQLHVVGEGGQQRPGPQVPQGYDVDFC